MRLGMANIITGCRILLSGSLLFAPVLSPLFFAVYFLAGFTDMADGFVARKENTVSEFGAKFDTIADLCFILAAAYQLFPVLHLPFRLWAWIAVIAVIKVTNLISTLALRKEFAPIHTFANKATGLLLFLFPLSLPLINSIYSASLLCIIASFAAMQECLSIRKH